MRNGAEHTKKRLIEFILQKYRVIECCKLALVNLKLALVNQNQALSLCYFETVVVFCLAFHYFALVKVF